MEDDILGWRHNADIKGHLLAINPIGDVHVGWTRQSWGLGRHFLCRVKRRMLRLLENIVPNPVVTAALHPTIVVAMHRMVAYCVAWLVAVNGLTLPRFQKRDAETIPNCHPKGARV